MKTATVNTRIEPTLKKSAEAIFEKVGLSTAEAVRLFYMQVCLHKGLPFEVKLPNDTTLAAIDEVESGQALAADDIDDIFSGV